MRIWDCVTGKPLAHLKHSDYVMAVAFAPSSAMAHKLAVGGGDKRVTLWEVLLCAELVAAGLTRTS